MQHARPQSRSGRRLTTLVDVLGFWASSRPERPAYTFCADGVEHTLGYAALDRRVRALAARLLGHGLRGTTTLLMYPPGLDFVIAFYACLYAGVIAVPVPYARGKSGRSRLASVVRSCRAKTLLTTTAYSGSLRRDIDANELSRLTLLLTDTAPVTTLELELQRIDPGAIAFLQYTSGSTAQPKGTVISHANIMANEAMLSRAFGTDQSSVIVSWLPLFHDMGLIGNMLHAAHLGAHAVLLSTLAVIRSPIVWLRTIDRYRATFSGAPNFAYDLCVRNTTPRERAGLDLSSWQVAFNGSEPVRRDTLRRFDDTFAPFGLQKRTLTPAYGLAEATLLVSASGARPATVIEVDEGAFKSGKIAPAESDVRAHSVVGCGQFQWGDQDVQIVDPDSRRARPPGEIGEIWISGSHVAQGYFDDPPATAETLHATLRGGERRYLRTGDLGFIRGDELFVTGRIKDLIIVRGQKLYAQDIEATVHESSPHVRQGGVAAFAIDVDGDDEPRLVVLAEVEARAAASPALLTTIVRQVRLAHELTIGRLALVARHRIPRTTSGKLQRQECKREYLSGAYAVLAEWSAPDAGAADGLRARIEAHAVRWMTSQRSLAAADVDVCAPLAGLGVDSITKVALSRSVEQELGIIFDEATFHEIQSIRDLGVSAARVACAGGAASARSLPSAGSEPLATPSSDPVGLVLPAFSALRWDGSK
jgi:acyl-CoA synthetase (AMP-forming)/AMP-acid ligase II/acyl carrier protein